MLSEENLGQNQKHMIINDSNNRRVPKDSERPDKFRRADKKAFRISGGVL
jgi:hypothetical protein